MTFQIKQFEPVAISLLPRGEQTLSDVPEKLLITKAIY